MHWKSSPTTMMLRCFAARMSANSAWSPLVSWYSSTSTWRKCSWSVRRTSSWFFRSSSAFTMRSSKSIAASSRFLASYFSAMAQMSSGVNPAAFVCHRDAIFSTGQHSFAASEIIFATTSFFGKSRGSFTDALMMSPISLRWSSSSRIWKPGG